MVRNRLFVTLPLIIFHNIYCESKSNSVLPGVHLYRRAHKKNRCPVRQQRFFTLYNQIRLAMKLNDISAATAISSFTFVFICFTILKGKTIKTIIY